MYYKVLSFNFIGCAIKEYSGIDEHWMYILRVTFTHSDSLQNHCTKTISSL